MKNFDPYASAFNKTYLINLLTKRKEKFKTFNEAIYEEPLLCAMADRLKPHELELLIDRIEYNR